MECIITMVIYDYEDFIKTLLASGFSMGGGNDEGIFSVVSFSWNEIPPYETSVRWHTGDPDTDPWEWRIRVLNERDDIAYSKLFFKKSGYITKQWYPYFLAARREDISFETAYQNGTISRSAKRIYDVVQAHGQLPVHDIKRLAGFGKAEKSAFDNALTQLQMKMYITMCASRQKISRLGYEYGWSSTVFCLTDDFFGSDVFSYARNISKEKSAKVITDQIYKLNPDANEKKINRFIYG